MCWWCRGWLGGRVRGWAGAFSCSRCWRELGLAGRVADRAQASAEAVLGAGVRAPMPCGPMRSPVLLLSWLMYLLASVPGLPPMPHPTRHADAGGAAAGPGPLQPPPHAPASLLAAG